MRMVAVGTRKEVLGTVVLGIVSGLIMSYF